MSIYLTVCVSVVPEAGGRKRPAEERPSKCLAEESSSVTVYLVSHVSVYVVATVCISLCQRYVSVYVSAMYQSMSALCRLYSMYLVTSR